MRRLAAVSALLVLAAGCGGGGDDGGGRTVTAQPGETVGIAAREYSFDPDRLVVGGSGGLTIRLRNEGDLAHDIRVRRAGEDVGGTPSFPPGESKSASLRLRPGKYELLCTVGDHAQLGMKGELEVR